MRALFLVMAALLTGCALPSPSATSCWRATFAHPTMTTEDIATPHELRVREAVEGASGRLK